MLSISSCEISTLSQECVIGASRLLPFTRSCDTLSNGLIGLIFSKHISNLACTSAGEGRSEDRYNKYTYYNAT
jgi:hypothetical protein